MADTLQYDTWSFSELTCPWLYRILQLRCEVFVVEQFCAFQDMDDLDQTSWHVCIHNANQLAGYARIVPPDDNTAGLPSVGRVIVAPAFRGQRLGYPLMQYAMRETWRRFADQDIYIGAQLRLRHYYQNLGFSDCGKPYLEDGIRHVSMMASVASFQAACQKSGRVH